MVQGNLPGNVEVPMREFLHMAQNKSFEELVKIRSLSKIKKLLTGFPLNFRNISGISKILPQNSRPF